MNEDRSCHFLTMQCGSCQRKYHIWSGLSINLNSPVYPVLQPGLVCQFDFEHVFGAKVDIEVNISDLSLGRRSNVPETSLQSLPETSHHCGSSFLGILAGDHVNNLQSVSTSCGEEHGLIFHLKQKSFLRLRLVSGNPVMGERGFVANVNVVRKSYKNSGKTAVIIISCVLIFFLICALFSCISNKIDERRQRQRRRRRATRRGMTWDSQNGRLTYHEQRTAVLRAGQESRVDGDQRGDNIYMIDTSVPRRLPHLPEFNITLDSKKEEVNNNNDETVRDLNPKTPDDYKLYETISLQSEKSPSYLELEGFDYPNDSKQDSSSRFTDLGN